MQTRFLSQGAASRQATFTVALQIYSREAKLRGSLASSVLVPFGVVNGILGIGSETGAAEEGGSQLWQTML